jgi:hypothetical protein
MRPKDCSLCAKMKEKPWIVWQPGASLAAAPRAMRLIGMPHTKDKIISN